MGKNNNGQFEYGLCNHQDLENLKQIWIYGPEMSTEEKAVIGLELLTSLTGRPYTLTPEGKVDCSFLNQSYRQIYVGSQCLNESGEELTEENYQQKMSDFADMMSRYLSVPVRDDSIPSVQVAANGIMHGVRMGLGVGETRRWAQFNNTADALALSYQPSIKEQVKRLAGLVGQNEPRDYAQHMMTELSGCFFDEQGQYSLEKLDELLDGMVEARLENMKKRGREVEQVLADLQHLEHKDGDGKSILYPQKNGDQLTAAELMAIDTVAKGGLSTKQDDAFAGQFVYLTVSEFRPESKIWKDYKAFKNIDPNTMYMAHYVQNKLISAVEKEKQTLPEDQKRTLMLGFHTQAGQYKKPEYTEEEKTFLDPYQTKKAAETEAACVKIQKQKEAGFTLIEPGKEEAFTANLQELMKLGEQFRLADHWYHKNHDPYNKLNKAMEKLTTAWKTIQEEKAEHKAAGRDAYLDVVDYNKLSAAMRGVQKAALAYVDEKETSRKTDLGKDRYALAMDILSKVNADRYRKEETRHNEIRESSGDVKKVSLKDLEKRAGKHAEKNRKELEKKGLLPAKAENKTEKHKSL